MVWILYKNLHTPILSNGYYFTKRYFSSIRGIIINIKEASTFNSKSETKNYHDWIAEEVEISPIKMPEYGAKSIGISPINLGYLIGNYSGFDPVSIGQTINNVFVHNPREKLAVYALESWESQMMFQNNLWLPEKWQSNRKTIPEDLTIDKHGSILVKCGEHQNFYEYMNYVHPATPEMHASVVVT